MYRLAFMLAQKPYVKCKISDWNEHKYANKKGDYENDKILIDISNTSKLNYDEVTILIDKS